MAAGTADPFRLPLEATDTSLLWVDGRVVVNAGHGDNDATVTVDPETGEVLVEIDGTAYRFPPGTPVTVRTGAGDDTIEVDELVSSDLVLIGGSGNDRIRSHGGDDILLGLGGKDDLFSTGGDNYVGDSDLLAHGLTIEELENDTENFRPNEGGEGSGENGHAFREGASPSWPGSSRIEYNPSFTFDHQNGNPATVLYHEMAHVYSYWNGNYDSSEFGVPQDDVSRAEYQAVGLPFNQNGLFETPDVRADPEQPSPFTENGWREESGRPERTSY